MFERGAPSGSELREIFVEVGGDRAEDRLVSRVFLLAQLVDQLLEVGTRRGDVLQLRTQSLEALFELAALAVRKGVGRADLFDPALEGAHLSLARLPTWDLLRRHTVRHARADLLHACLKQLRLA